MSSAADPSQPRPSAASERPAHPSPGMQEAIDLSGNYSRQSICRLNVIPHKFTWAIREFSDTEGVARKLHLA